MPLIWYDKFENHNGYFIITLCTKMVHAFAVSSVVGDTMNIKMFGMLPMTEHNG